MKKFSKQIGGILVFMISVILSFNSCTDEDNTLAPYAGSPDMSGIVVQEGSFTPQIIWNGGFANVVGVNKGSRAALDSSLVWLVSASGNTIRYPIVFGEVPPGALDLTAQYGGIKQDSLSEDEGYTFWVMKEDLWNQISAQQNKFLQIDSSLTSLYSISGDTIFVGPRSHTSKAGNLDVFVNITNLVSQGQLAQIMVTSTNSNKPIISWTLRDVAVDSNISAIGIVAGQQFKPFYVLWDMYSLTDSAGVNLYGRENIISKPIQVGDVVPGTILFTEFRDEGLERGRSYYVWIGNKNWDRTNRSRFAPGYAYATFDVR